MAKPKIFLTRRRDVVECGAWGRAPHQPGWLSFINGLWDHPRKRSG